MTKQSPKVNLSYTVEMTKEERESKSDELWKKIRQSKELRETLMQTDDPAVALKAINDSGIDMTDDEFEQITMKNFEMMIFQQRMFEKAAKINDSGVIPRYILIFGAPASVE